MNYSEVDNVKGREREKECERCVQAIIIFVVVVVVVYYAG
jgi:hypothetical protein